MKANEYVGDNDDWIYDANSLSFIITFLKYQMQNMRLFEAQKSPIMFSDNLIYYSIMYY